MSETNRAVLTFYTDGGGTMQVSIPRANPAKTAQAAEQYMGNIIDLGILQAGSDGFGTPNAIHSVILERVVRESLIN
jgi:hypothetical protein